MDAARLHESGRLDEAAAAYRAILDERPLEPDALRLLGVVALQQGRIQEAGELFARALAVRPTHAATISNLGDAALAGGNYADAEQYYRRALMADAAWVPALRNLGKILFARGDHAHAAEVLVRAANLDAHDFESLRICGLSLIALGRGADAIALLEAAVALRGDANLVETLAVLHNNAAAGHLEGLRAQEAAASAARAVELAPAMAAAHANLGAAQIGLGRIDEGLKSCERALRFDPCYARAHMLRGDGYAALGDTPSAIAAFEAALALAPDDAATLTRLAHAYERSDIDRAIALHRRAVASAPQWYAAHTNLAGALFLAGDNDGGMMESRATIALAPDYEDAHLGLGESLLRAGRFAEGWPELRWRWLHPHRAAPTPYRDQITYWDGAPFSGKRLLIGRDQGLGDAIMMLRFVSQAKARGGEVIVESPPELLPLARLVQGADEVFAFGETVDPGRFDLYAPMMSLPMLLGTTMETIPAPHAYLHVPRDAASRWAHLREPKALHIGVVWSGNPHQSLNAVRSCQLEEFAPLARMKGVRLFSLQLDGAAHIAACGLPITDLGSEISSFADTAAILAQLDLLITIDSAPAHLAGALGRPVWVLLCTRSHWMYHLDRSDSPWYPSMRLFRQPRLGDWATVFEQVIEALKGEWPEACD